MTANDHPGPRPYNDPEYRAMKRWLRHHPNTPCSLALPGCTGAATTLDHSPRLSEHTHQRGTRCCTLRPACAHCNYSDGADHTPRTHADNDYAHW